MNMWKWHLFCLTDKFSVTVSLLMTIKKFVQWLILLWKKNSRYIVNIVAVDYLELQEAFCSQCYKYDEGKGKIMNWNIYCLHVHSVPENQNFEF